MADVTNIAGRINSISQEGVAVVASQTLDERKNKKQSVVNQETDEELANHGQRIGTLEQEVGSGGSVDERIAQAKSESESDIKGGASSDYDTLKKAEDAIKAEAAARQEADSSLDGRMRTLEDNSVRYTPQTPSQTEQAHARTNLDTYSKAEVNQIASAFTEQNYVSVQAVAATTAADIPTLINATGDGEQTDTLYRVGWFDGTAFDVTKYSLYTWNGTAYVQMAVCSSIGEVFDISVYNQSGGTPAQYETLALALGTDGANVPSGVRQGGMSVKFIQSSDNKYVQYRYMGTDTTGNPNPFLNTANWQNEGDGSDALSNIKLYVCNQGYATTQKNVNADGFKLIDGGAIKIKFTHKNTAENATLNINSTGAFPIILNGEPTSAFNTWGDGAIISFYYSPDNSGKWIGTTETKYEKTGLQTQISSSKKIGDFANGDIVSMITDELPLELVKFNGDVPITNPNRAIVSNYIRAPFKIITNDGYTIANVVRYTYSIDGSINQLSSEIVNYSKYVETDSNYLYKIIFRKSNDAVISDEDLGDIIDEYSSSFSYISGNIDEYEKKNVVTTFVSGKYINSSGVELSSQSNVEASDYIPCVGIKYIRTNVSLRISGLCIAFYDGKKVFIPNSSYSVINTRAGYYHYLEVPENAAYFRVSNLPDVVASPVILCYGLTTPEDYMLYSEDYTEAGEVSYNNYGVISSVNVVWSDGTSGVLTYTDWSTPNNMYRGYEVTYGSAKKLIQPAVTLTDYRITSVPNKFIINL